MIWKNFGIFNGKAGFIDLGKFYINPEMKNPQKISEDLSITMGRFHKWLNGTYPSLANYLDERLKTSPEGESL